MKFVLELALLGPQGQDPVGLGVPWARKHIFPRKLDKIVFSLAPKLQGAAELASGCLLYWNSEILCFSKAMNAFQDFVGLNQKTILWFCWSQINQTLPVVLVSFLPCFISPSAVTSHQRRSAIFMQLRVKVRFTRPIYGKLNLLPEVETLRLKGPL